MTILTPTQIRLLERFAQEPFIRDTFYFTGGTPLAAFYLQHRYSEDLDFFSENEFDPQSFLVFCKKLKTEGLISGVDYEQSFNRNMYQLSLGDEVVKTEFTYFPFPRLEHGIPHYGLQADSMLDIAVNKLFTIYQRSKARDYIDLYLLCREKGYKLDDLQKKARAKFDFHIDPLQLGTQFIKAETAEDTPRMIIELPNKEWQDFFMEAAKALKDDVLEQ